MDIKLYKPLCRWWVRCIVWVILSVATGYHAQAQSFQLSGKIIDVKTNLPIEGANITIGATNVNTSSAADGSFSVTLPSKSVTLTVSHLGYVKKKLSVEAGRSLTISLQPVGIDIEEVVVAVKKNTNTERAVLDERRKSANIQDAISAQLIARTASITTTQALQRVTGVTVTDEKYVAVRGLGDRSVIGQLNGVRLASSNPDRSTIPLDLVPASLLDNITVFKSFTPDKPADAASGIVELKTKSIPDRRTLEFSVQSGFNSNIGVGGRYNSFDNASMGFFGSRINKKDLSDEFLNLSSQYPDGLASIQRQFANANFSAENRQEVNRINGLMQSFDQILTTGYRKAPVNQNYALSFGDNYKLRNGHTIGLILGGNYYRRYTDIYGGELSQYSVYQGVLTGNADIQSQRNIPNYITPNNINLGRYQHYKENTGTETLNYGVLGGLAYRFSPLHQVSAQFVGSWGGETQASNMLGAYEYSGLNGNVESAINSLKQTFRKLYVYNLQGEHRWSDDEYAPRLSWNAATSRATHNDPDYRFTSLATYTPNDASLSKKYALTSGYVNGYGPYGVIQAEPNGRRWRQLDEDNYNYKADLTIPFSFLGQKQELKVGGNYLYRERNYGENQLFIPGSNYTENGNQFLYEVDGNLNRLVSNEYIGINANAATKEGAFPVTGFLYNILKSPNNYHGFYETNAFYGMLDLRLDEKWRFTGGVRFENTDIASRVDTANVFLDPSLTQEASDGTRLPMVNIEPNSRYRTGYKPYYSINVTYAHRPDMNFRAGYNTTLARPELREITNVFEYDPFQMGLVVGNPDLVNQKTQNLDIRWEWFTAPGEVIALSAFGKRIHNQLVKVYSLNTLGVDAKYPEFPIIQFQNEQNIGRVWGLEAEVVKDLGKLWTPLQHFFLGANLMVAQSDIKKSQARYDASHTLDRNAPTNSPLFEQAPYSVNAWLNYTDEHWGTDLTASFNVVGERLVQINLLGEPDLYSQPTPTLDFVLSQRLYRGFTLKAFAKNVLNPANKIVYANPGTGGTWYGREYIQRSYKRGVEFMLGLTYNVF